jgi:hypothetical protein
MTTSVQYAAMRRPTRFAAVALVAVALAACESPYVTIAPDVGADATRLASSEGTATSHLLLAYFIYAPFVPWRWDERQQTAYGTAVTGVPGATALENVTIQENWYYWVIGTSRRLTVRGDAVKR